MLASFDSASRRVQSIVEAYSAGGTPHFKTAQIIAGYKGPGDAVSAQLRKGKEEELGPRCEMANEPSWQTMQRMPLPTGRCLRGPKPKPRPGTVNALLAPFILGRISLAIDLMDGDARQHLEVPELMLTIRELEYLR